MLEVEVDGDIEVIVNTNVEVIAGNMNIAIIEDTNDIEVTVNRQEYVITGDEIYIPKRFEDAPTWMQNLITQVVDTSISAQIQDLNGISQSLESMIDAMEVAKNTYELSIISSNDIDERINTAVTTLNSAMNEADATVLEVAQTRVTPEEAAVITVDVITAELAKTEAGTLGATVSNLQTAVANEEEARSTSIEILTSSIEGAFDANATAMNYINTYVGLDEVGASTGTGLSGYLESSTGIIGGADSKVVNNVYVDALGNAKSKFEYGSTVSVNGVTSTAGFGLSNSTGTGIGSEFWINAAKFKFTNNNKTGSKAPFTIDATGTVPEITFNGKVSFNNVTDYTPPDISGTINNNNDAFARRLGYISYADMVAAATAGQTIINGGYLRTSLIQANAINANQINTTGLVAENISSTTIDGKTITGSVITGAVIKASYLDLDGELEVLTNYHITIPMYSSNPSLYIDAVLLVDEYRIPSISQMREYNINSSSNISGRISSYSTANVGNNLKAVRIRPYIRIENQFTAVNINQSWGNGGLHYKSSYTPFIFKILLGSKTMCRITCSCYGSAVSPTGLDLTRFTVERYGISTSNYDFRDDVGGSLSIPVNIGIGGAILNIGHSGAWSGSLWANINVDATNDFNPIQTDFTEGKLISIVIEHASGWQSDPGTYWNIPYPSIYTKIDSGIIINNML